MSDFLARPWLLLTAPIIYWVLKELLRPAIQNSWADFLPPELAKRLLTQSEATTQAPLLVKLNWVLGLLTLLFTLALAGVGYVLKADQVPSFQQELVVIQYLSPPIRGDAAPQRQLEASQRALIPILNARKQGKTALIYYAGSAHLVSPITDDTTTLRQLFSLTNPSVMPLGGHNPEAAFHLAARLGKLAVSNKQGRLDWLWVTASLPSKADLQTLLKLKPQRAKLYLVWLDANQLAVEKEQSAFTDFDITLLHPDQLAEYALVLNRSAGIFTEENQQNIWLFQELSHWPLLVGMLLLLWQYFGQPRFKQSLKLRFWLLALVVGLTSQEPLQAASWQNPDRQAWQAIQAANSAKVSNKDKQKKVTKAQKLASRTDLKAHAEFLLGNYTKAAELFVQWQEENPKADKKQQAEMLFNRGTAWLLAEKPKLALNSFNSASELIQNSQQEITGLVCNQLLAKWQLAELQSTQLPVTEQELFDACGGASERDGSSSKDSEEDETQPEQEDWLPEENTSCIDCEELDATQEKQLQQLQEDPWRLLRHRFKSELKEQRP